APPAYGRPGDAPAGRARLGARPRRDARILVVMTAIRLLGPGIALLLVSGLSAQTAAPARAEQARPLLSEASRLARGLAARSVHLSLIADLQVVAGDVDGARETARAMGDPSRSAALRVAGIAQATVGDV